MIRLQVVNTASMMWCGTLTLSKVVDSERRQILDQLEFELQYSTSITAHQLHCIKRYIQSPLDAMTKMECSESCSPRVLSLFSLLKAELLVVQRMLARKSM
jgi:hypothetical protein